MSVWAIPLGMNVQNNPIIDSPFVAQYDEGLSYPFPGAYDLITEGGSFILTEGGDYLTTE